MREKHALEKILGDFGLESADRDPGKPVTIWLPSDFKARFDKLQRSSGRKFGKKVKELIQAAIELAESRAS